MKVVMRSLLGEQHITLITIIKWRNRIVIFLPIYLSSFFSIVSLLLRIATPLHANHLFLLVGLFSYQVEFCAIFLYISVLSFSKNYFSNFVPQLLMVPHSTCPRFSRRRCGHDFKWNDKIFFAKVLVYIISHATLGIRRPSFNQSFGLNVLIPRLPTLTLSRL